jgi:RHS repeat-associated protein
VESDAYDAWGRPRNAATGADNPTCPPSAPPFSNRGYTGQEHMPDVCLVNMNARIYDPTLGKFLSPDDVVPDAYNGQSYNRYTYVDDNPLSYDDPTGHVPGITQPIQLGDEYTNEQVPANADRGDGPDSQAYAHIDDEQRQSKFPVSLTTMSGMFGHGMSHTMPNGLTSSSPSPSGLSTSIGSSNSSPIPESDYDGLDPESAAGDADQQIAQQVPEEDEDTGADPENQSARDRRIMEDGDAEARRENQAKADDDAGLERRTLPDDPTFDKLINRLDGDDADNERYRSKIDRNAFRNPRAKFWQSEAEHNPEGYTPENLERMQHGDHLSAGTAFQWSFTIRMERPMVMSSL